VSEGEREGAGWVVREGVGVLKKKNTVSIPGACVSSQDRVH
jgi:hypothetical protein